MFGNKKEETPKPKEQSKEQTSKEETPKPKKETSNSFSVKKLIKNPLKLDMSVTLHNYLPYELNNLQLANKKFMEHINKLISLKKLEKI